MEVRDDDPRDPLARIDSVLHRKGQDPPGAEGRDPLQRIDQVLGQRPQQGQRPEPTPGQELQQLARAMQTGASDIYTGPEGRSLTQQVGRTGRVLQQGGQAPAGGDPSVQPGPVETPLTETPSLQEQLQAYEAENPFFSRIYQRLRSGVKGVQHGVASVRSRDAAERVQAIDRLMEGTTAEELFQEDPKLYQRAVEAGAADTGFFGSREAADEETLRQLREEQLGELHQRVRRSVEIGREIQDIPRNPVAEQFAAAEDFGTAYQLFKEDPAGVIAQTGLESLPRSLPGMVAGGLATAAGGPALGALATGAGSAGQEIGPRFMEGLQKQGVDTSDPEELATALQNPALVASANEYANTAASAIGLFDAASMGLAGRAAGEIAEVPLRRQIGRLARETALQLPAQAALGGAGEATAQLATEGEITGAGEVAAEVAGELLGLETAGSVLSMTGGQAARGVRTLRNRYKIRQEGGDPDAAGRQVTPSQAAPTLEDMDPDERAQAEQYLQTVSAQDLQQAQAAMPEGPYQELIQQELRRREEQAAQDANQTLGMEALRSRLREASPAQLEEAARAATSEEMRSAIRAELDRRAAELDPVSSYIENQFAGQPTAEPSEGTQRTGFGRGADLPDPQDPAMQRAQEFEEYVTRQFDDVEGAPQTSEERRREQLQELRLQELREDLQGARVEKLEEALDEAESEEVRQMIFEEIDRRTEERLQEGEEQLERGAAYQEQQFDDVEGEARASAEDQEQFVPMDPAELESVPREELQQLSYPGRPPEPPEEGPAPTEPESEGPGAAPQGQQPESEPEGPDRMDQARQAIEEGRPEDAGATELRELYREARDQEQSEADELGELLRQRLVDVGIVEAIDEGQLVRDPGGRSYRVRSIDNDTAEIVPVRGRPVAQTVPVEDLVTDYTASTAEAEPDKVRTPAGETGQDVSTPTEQPTETEAQQQETQQQDTPETTQAGTAPAPRQASEESGRLSGRPSVEELRQRRDQLETGGQLGLGASTFGQAPERMNEEAIEAEIHEKEEDLAEAQRELEEQRQEIRRRRQEQQARSEGTPSRQGPGTNLFGEATESAEQQAARQQQTLGEQMEADVSGEQTEAALQPLQDRVNRFQRELIDLRARANRARRINRASEQDLFGEEEEGAAPAQETPDETEEAAGPTPAEISASEVRAELIDTVNAAYSRGGDRADHVPTAVMDLAAEAEAARRQREGDPSRGADVEGVVDALTELAQAQYQIDRGHKRARGTRLTDARRQLYEQVRQIEEATGEQLLPSALTPETVLEGQYYVDALEGRVKVYNQDTGQAIGGRSRHYADAVGEYFASQEDTIERTTNRAQVADRAGPGEILRMIVQTSENPIELVETLEQAQEQTQVRKESLEPWQEELLDSNMRISTSSYDDAGDPVTRQDNPAITLNWLSSEPNARGIYELADELSEHGRRVTADDILQLIDDRPNRTRSRGGRPDRIEEDLRDRFEDLTGVKLTDTVASAIQERLAPPDEGPADTLEDVPFQRRRAGELLGEAAAESGQSRPSDIRQAVRRAEVAQAAAEYVTQEQLPGVDVRPTAEALPEGPRRIYKAHARQNPRYRQTAMYYDGEVYLIADEILAAAEEAAVTPQAFTEAAIRHELIAHEGLRGVLGEHFTEGMNAVYDAIGEERIKASGVYDAYSSQGRATAELSADRRALMAEEYLARMAEGLTVDPGVAERILDAIRRALGRVFGYVSDAELKNLLRHAAVHLRTQQAQQIKENRDLSPRFLLAGRGAETFAEAEEAGRTFEGPFDGLTRFEIDDSRAALDLEQTFQLENTPEGVHLLDSSLRTYLDHPDFYEAYPEAPGDIDLAGAIGEGLAKKGSYNYNNRTVQAQASSEEELLSVILHELQHYIQYEEDFAKGSNFRRGLDVVTEELQDARAAYEQVQRIRESEAYQAESEAFREDLQDPGISQDEALQRRNQKPAHRRVNSLNAMIRELGFNVTRPRDRQVLADEATPRGEMAFIKERSLRRYRDSAGEIEAREVERRMNFTAGERELVEPFEGTPTPDRVDVRFQRRREGEDPKRAIDKRAQVVSANRDRFSGTLNEQRDTALAYAREHFQGESFENKDTGWTVRVSRSTLDKIVKQFVEEPDRAALHLALTAELPTLIREAVRVNSHPDREGRPSIEAIHRFFVPVRDAQTSRVYPGKLTVREYQGADRKAHAFEVVEAEIDEELAVPQDAHPGVVRPATSSSLSLRDLVGEVSFDDEGRARGPEGGVRFQQQETTEDEAGAESGRSEGTPSQGAPSFEDFQERFEAALEEEPKEQGRPELANPAETEEVRRGVDVVDQTREDEGIPERQSFDEWRQEAERMLDENYEGTKERLFTGGMESAADVMAAKMLVEREGLEAIAADDPEQLKGFARMVNSYRTQRTETARALAAGRDPEKTPAERQKEFLVEAVVMPSDETARRLDAAETEEEIERILDEHAGEVQHIREVLSDLGLDPTQMSEEELQDPKSVAQVIRTVRTTEARAGDKVYEYWINAILSAPTTQAANIIGNSVNASWEFIIQRPMEAVVNEILTAVTGTPGEGARVGEIRHLWAGLLGGTLKDAWRNMALAWETESPVFAEEMGYTGQQTKLEERSGAIGGAAGRAIRIPGRMLVAADEAFKTLFWNLQVGAEAYRIAKREGLEGEALKGRIQELRNNPQSAAGVAAFDKALELTFQEETGISDALSSMRRDLPGLKYLLPFVRTPTNIFRAGLRKSPFGAARMLWRAMREGTYQVGLSSDPEIRYRRREFARDAAEQILAWGGLWMLWSLTEDDEDDEPWITGTSADYANRGRIGLQRRAYPALSVRIGDTWYSYARIEPLASMLGLTVDLIEEAQAAEAGKPTEDALGTAWGRILNLTKEKTFFKGIGDLVRAIEYESSAFNMAQDFVTSWVPNFIRSAARSSDDVFRDTRARGEGRRFAGELLESTVQEAVPSPEAQRALTGEVPPPGVDLWGRESRRYGRARSAPYTDLIYRMTVPIWRQEADRATRIDRLILNWNNQNPTEGFYPTLPRPSWQVKGETVRLTSEEYHRFLREAGQLAFERLQDMSLSVDEPTETDLEKIEDAIRDSRRQIKSQMIRERAVQDLPQSLSTSDASDRTPPQGDGAPTGRRRAGALLEAQQ